MDETLVELLMDLMNASFEQGKAVQRGDAEQARKYQRDSLYAFQLVLDAARSRTAPAEPGA